MAIGEFGFEPAEVPKATRGRRGSKYVATVEAIYEYLQQNKQQRSVKIELGGVSVKAASPSFRAAVAKTHPDVLRLVQRGGDLYIEKKR